MARSVSSSRTKPRGFALVVVLLVLAALIALATPFLLSMRNESRATGGRVDLARARASALGAREHARKALAESYASKDLTPLFDGEEELQAPPLPKDFFSASNPHGEIWSAQVEDEQGKINLNSASPFVFARLFGYTTLSGDLSTEDAEIAVSSTEGFPAQGFLWIRGELIRYQAKTGSAFQQCQRGFLSDTKRFLEPQKHKRGAPVLDDRVCALARWRIQDGKTFRGYDTLLSLPRAGEASVAGALPQEFFDPMLPLCTVFSQRGGAGNWGAASRISSPLTAGETRDLVVANSRYVAEGSTIRIWGKDGKVEYALVVQSSPGAGQVKLAAPVLHDYDPFEAQLQPLVRHPINANTASIDLLVRMLSYLHLRQRSLEDWVTPEEAGEVVRRIVASRPLRGFEDFVRRVLKPAIEEHAISALDAQAIYCNALQGDDGGLDSPSMPLSFATGDVYQINSGVSINTPLGAERARTLLREVVAVAPQEPLLRIFANQQAFEEEMRLTRESRWWMSGPNNTSIFDASANPPSRDIGQIQEAVTQEHYFPSEDFETSWLGSQPSRKLQAGPQGNFLHFDYAWNPDGARIDGEHWTGSPGVAPASLAGDKGYLFPGAIEAWFKTKTWNGTFFDIADVDSTRNRVQLYVDQGNLVLRAFDDAGDDPDSTLVEAGEIRMPLTELAGASDVWTHLSASWHGNRPSDLLLAVDGVKRGKPRGQTRLTGALSDFVPTPTAWSPATIQVESTDGFPDSGVIRIGGSEVVEYTSKSGNSFVTAWPPKTGSGLDTWMSGREARLGKDSTSVALPHAVTYNTQHAAGTGVELYGYSAMLQSNLPPGGATVGADLGKFSVGRLITGDSSKQAPGDAIGIFGQGIKPDTKKKWILEPVVSTDTKFMNAFSKNGGFALVFQGNREGSIVDSNMTFGAEIVHYTGHSDKELFVNQRAVALPKLTPGSVPGLDGQPHAFVTFWNSLPGGTDWSAYNTSPCAWVYIVPISIAVQGFSDVNYQANDLNSGLSEIVQIYDSSDEGKTEWVRFDDFVQGSLVRSDPHAIQAGRDAVNLTNFSDFQITDQTESCPSQPDLTKPAVAQPLSIGLPEILNVNSLVYRFSKAMKHRGVLGTFSHDQKSSAQLIPVVQVPRNSGVKPGRNDRVCVIAPGSPFPNAWRTINWAYYPDNTDNIPTSKNVIDLARVYLSFKEQPKTLIADNFPTSTWSEDVREYVRLVKFPSGELPIVNSVHVGSSIDGTSPPVDGQVDEIEFVSGTAPGAIHASTSLASYVLQENLSETAKSLILLPKTLAAPNGSISYTNEVLPALPKDGGLLRIDEEILGYIEYDAVTGTVTLSPNGRGMLNSEPSAHGKRAPVQFLDHMRASKLTAGLSPYSLTIPVEDPGKFPSEGTLFIEKELMHFTNKAGGALLMPGRKLDERDKEYSDKEEGIFRGRYGTGAAAHASGTLAVNFPFRYWDRAPRRTDCAELSFFGMHVDAPGGWFQTLYWEEDPSLRDPFVHLEALARIDDWANWEDEPGTAPGLYVFEQPIQDNRELLRLDRGGNRLELRFYTRYLPGAFDAENFLSHSWKRAPHLRKVAVGYLAPSQVLWRGESRW